MHIIPVSQTLLQKAFESGGIPFLVVGLAHLFNVQAVIFGSYQRP